MRTTQLKGIDNRDHEQVVVGGFWSIETHKMEHVTTDVLTIDELYRHCDACRDTDGFCSCNNGCSGPYFWETRPDGISVYKGCNKFYVR